MRRSDVESSKAPLLLSPHSSHQLIGEILGLTVQITVIKIHFLNYLSLGPVCLPVQLTAHIVCFRLASGFSHLTLMLGCWPSQYREDKRVLPFKSRGDTASNVSNDLFHENDPGKNLSLDPLIAWWIKRKIKVEAGRTCLGIFSFLLVFWY